MKEAILIIDDNAANLKLARIVVSGEGYEVRTATDANDATRVLASFTPRLILLDIQLPGLDGLSFARQLKADPKWQSLRIIALTAYAMKGDEDRARAAGCDGYVSKPIDTEVLLAEIRRQLEG